MAETDMPPTSPEIDRKREVLRSVFEIKGVASSIIDDLSRKEGPVVTATPPPAYREPVSELLPSAVKRVVEKERRADDREFASEVKKAEKKADQVQSQKIEERSDEIKLATEVRDETGKWDSFLSSQEKKEDDFQARQQAISEKRAALQQLSGRRSSAGKEMAGQLQREIREQERQLANWATDNVPSALWAEYGVPSSVIAEKRPLISVHSAEDTLARRFTKEEDNLRDFALAERERIKTAKVRGSAPEIVKDELYGTELEAETQRKRADEAEKQLGMLREQHMKDMKEAQGKTDKVLEDNEKLQERLNEANAQISRVERERDMAIREAENANREVQLLLDRGERLLTADELNWLGGRGHLSEDRLTPEEKRVLANAGYRDMNDKERLAVAGADIKNSLEDVTGRLAHYIDDRAELFGAAGGLVVGAGLRAFLVHEGYDVMSADLFARTAASPAIALRLAMGLAERIPLIRNRELTHPTATRRIRGLANAAVTGVLGWAGESMIAPVTSHAESATINTDAHKKGEHWEGPGQPSLTSGPKPDASAATTTPTLPVPVIGNGLNADILKDFPVDYTVKPGDSLWSVATDHLKPVMDRMGISLPDQNIVIDAFKDQTVNQAALKNNWLKPGQNLHVGATQLQSVLNELTRSQLSPDARIKVISEFTQLMTGRTQ